MPAMHRRSGIRGSIRTASSLRWALFLCAMMFAGALFADGSAATSGGQDKEYTSAHFRIISPLDPRYVAYIQANAEAYYRAVIPLYFKQGYSQPLTIYYGRNADDTRRWFKQFDISHDIPMGLYVGSARAIFTQRELDDGGLMGIGTLFHEITHHFVAVNWGSPPTWFNEGMASFLGEQSRIVGGRLSLGHANPWREQVLRDELDSGMPLDLRSLCTVSQLELTSARSVTHRARLVFLWLYRRGLLLTYLQAARKHGYGLDVLTQTAGLSADALEAELLKFFKQECYPAAYLKDSQDAFDQPERRKALLLQAIALKPGYQPALVDLANMAYHGFQFEECRRLLEVSLKDLLSPQHVEALVLAGDSYYEQHNYTAALQHYQDALAIADFSEQKPIIYYSIGNCLLNLNQPDAAREMYAKFLEAAWAPEQQAEQVVFARQYLSGK